MVEAYEVGPYLSIFFQDRLGSSLSYEAIPRLKSELEYQLLEDLIGRIAEIKYDGMPFRIGITERLRHMVSAASGIVANLFPEMRKESISVLATVAAHRTVVLDRFFPILLDDDVEEIYLDAPSRIVYFDHSRLGRCRSNFSVESDDVSRIVTLLRTESNNHLDYQNPSLKTDLNLNEIQLRFSAGIPPLSPDGLCLQIRRAATNPYSILDLVLNRTMSKEIAAVLILAIGCRMNITIVGEPGAGKTTLLNALDMVTPPLWRKIYIEDAIESRTFGNQHQLRIKVDSIDEANSSLNKSDEIVKSLHRSPDYLILGEIQTAEHSRALFQALAAGLRSAQTCHGGSASNILTRWTSNHRIPRSSIALMDIIVTVLRPKTGTSIRKVQEIIEIRKDLVDGVFELKGFGRIFDRSVSKNEIESWASDGAFQRRLQEMENPDYEQQLSDIVAIIQDYLSKPRVDFDTFVQDIWNREGVL
ncbi:MAG: ATPase, T2SS/T4P/T4SS family [Candidatus Thorarchaeota archaeon]